VLNSQGWYYSEYSDIMKRKLVGIESSDFEDNSILHEKTLRLHEIFMVIVVVFCIIYTGVDLWLGQYMQASITFSTIFFTGISFVLYKQKKYFISKVWNMLILTLIIQLLVIQTGIDSYVFIYFIPLLMGNLFVFQGKEAKAGYVILTIDAILMINSMLFLDYFTPLPKMNPDLAKMDGFMNLVGVSIICIAETYFIVKVTDGIHRKLVIRTSALKLKNEQLISTLYTRERMMSVLSHDLRSPVASLDSASELLLNGEIDRETEQAILKQFKGRTSGMLDLIDKLLLWTRAQTNNIQYIETNIPLKELEDLVNNICLLSATDKSIEYSVNFINSNAEKVLGDRDMLETVFRNLISNATKYSNKGGIVQITANSTPMGCCFRVVDSGVGMSADFMKKMNSGEGISTRGTKNEIGHGLGLQLVNDFLSKHNTQLNVSSVVGKGSEFYFYLKIA
jgi:two-component system sensor histidine kinase/response regulator